MSIHDHRYTQELVSPIASVSRIAITSDKVKSYSETFNKIMDMFETMDQCDTDDVMLSDFIVSSESSLREDTATNVDITESLEIHFAHFSGGYFKVPKVIE
ncbi:MAG: Asp-tRNA(Asn)/Glu-tRNA(Gln) amidotransferase subunit GatC [Candidatus Comchoanobacterales bacterium]